MSIPDEPSTAPAPDADVLVALHAVSARRAATMVAVAWLLFGLMHHFAGRPWVTAVHLAACLGCGAAIPWTRRSPVGALGVLGSASLLGLVLVAAMTGGALAPAMAFLGLVPLLVGLLELRAHRVAWLGVSLAGIASVSTLQTVLPDESGGLTFIEATAAPVGLGILAFFIGTAWRRASADQIRLLEERQKEIAGQAAALAAQRTELEAARQAAERASAAKSSFVGMTAHELRGPLNGLIGMAHALADTKLGAHQADLVAAIRTSAESLSKVTQDLLDLARIEAGKVDVTRAPYEPRELCADVLDAIAGAAAEKGLAIGWTASPEVPYLATDDAGRLRQVLGNLATNAVKFTASGEIRIDVAQTQVDGAPHLVYSVADTGRGIEPEHVERIFAPFEQVSDELLDRRAGTGLGLWISRRFVEAMGGRLRVESVPRKGSSFFVELPLVPARATLEPRLVLPDRPHFVVQAAAAIERDTARSVAQQLEADVSVVERLEDVLGAVRPETLIVVTELTPVTALQALALPEGVTLALAASARQFAAAEKLATELDPPGRVVLKPLRATRVAGLLTPVASGEPAPAPTTTAEVQGTLLVVDDDAINRKVVHFAAGRLGYKVVEAGSGEEALALLAEQPVDVVLLDLHMTGMDGVATARAITARFAPAKRPSLLAHTGSVNEEDRARCLGVGMEEVVAKPLDPGELGAALSRARRAQARRRLSGSLATMDALPVLHGETLATFRSMMGPEGDELARTFLTELPARVGRVVEACRSRDRDALRLEAHTLASAAATFGGARLALACRRVELNAAAEPFATLDSRVSEVEARGGQLGPVLARALAEGDGPA